MPYILYVSLKKIYVYPLKSKLLKYCKANNTEIFGIIYKYGVESTVEVWNKFTLCEAYAYLFYR